MTISTENATPLKSSESRNSNSSEQIQMRPRSQFEFVLWDTEESKFFDMVGFGDVAFSLETVTVRVSNYGTIDERH